MRLHVTTSGKYWHYRYRWEGKGKELSLGTYPTVSLKEARERHEEARTLLDRGVNPTSYRKQMKAAKIEVNARSFQAIAVEWLARSLQSQRPTKASPSASPRIRRNPRVNPPKKPPCPQRLESQGTERPFECLPCLVELPAVGDWDR